MRQDRRSPSWKVIAITSVGLIFTIITPILYSNTQSSIVKLQDEKLDKTEYYKDFKGTQERLKKIDDIYEMLLNDQRILKKHREATEGITP